MVSDQLVKLSELGKFSLHKWYSSLEFLMKDINSEMNLGRYSVVAEEVSNKILGISWNPKTDCFSISAPESLNVL